MACRCAPPFLAAALILAALPGSAQDRAPAAPGGLSEGVDLMQRGLQSMLDGLITEMRPAIDGMGRALTDLRPMAEDLRRLVDDIGNYEAPVILDNGDILIRRKPDPPRPLREGETEL
jgi:hypothetical protein